MIEIIRERLIELSEEKYRDFQSKLCPNVDNIIGVRLPLLRKIAKEIAKSDWHEYAESHKTIYFEEVMIQGMILGYVNCELEELLEYVEKFVPKIDNWSICDSFCIGLKFTKSNKKRVWDFLKEYIHSEKEYEIRFAVVMLLDFYIDEEHIYEVLDVLDKINHEGYYAKMAIAWAISICFTNFPHITMNYLKDNNLDDFTYNKSLQKITESLKVDNETKCIIKKMKRVN